MPKLRVSTWRPPDERVKDWEAYRVRQIRLAKVVSMVYDVQKFRIASGNRKKKSGAIAIMPINLRKEDIAWHAARMTEFKAIEKTHLKQTAALLKPFTAMEWLVRIPAAGPITRATMCSAFDVYRERTPSQAWAFAGLHVVDGMAPRPKEGAVTKDGSKGLPWSKRLHSKMWLFASNMYRSNVKTTADVDGPPTDKKVDYSVWTPWVDVGSTTVPCPTCCPKARKKAATDDDFVVEEDDEDVEVAEPDDDDEAETAAEVDEAPAVIRPCDTCDSTQKVPATKWARGYALIGINRRQRTESMRLPCKVCGPDGKAKTQANWRGEGGGKVVTCWNCRGTKTGPWGNSNKHRQLDMLRGVAKTFLWDFWVVARLAEGLPLVRPYAVEKLGQTHYGQTYVMSTIGSKAAEGIDWIKEGCDKVL